jgi:hypothetical protein
MDQGTITTFKAYYITKTSEEAIAKTTDDNAISLQSSGNIITSDLQEKIFTMHSSK